MVGERAHRESTDAPQPPWTKTGEYIAGLWGTLPHSEEGCGRMIASSVKSTWYYYGRAEKSSDGELGSQLYDSV